MDDSAENNPIEYIVTDGRTETVPFVKAEANGINVVYYRADGTGVERSGGSRSWRNNNPGNIRNAPPNENDTENYQNMIANFTRLDTSRLLTELSQEELDYVAQAIQRIEGYIAGTETNFTKR